jgi:uncharacterized membrane protein YccC
MMNEASKAPAYISIVVLATFGIALILTFSITVPTGSEALLNVILGSLVAMAGQVVSYWVGSSSGSVRKTELLTDANKK